MAIDVEFKKRVKNTAYSRFFAARRYEKLNNYSLFSLTAASFCLIFATIFQSYSNSIMFSPTTLELFQLVSSIIIATLSIVVSLSSYSTKAEKMRTSGEELNFIVSQIEQLLNNCTEAQENEIRTEYDYKKVKSLNHQNFEFEYGKAERKREENGESVKISVSSILHNWLPFIPYATISAASIIFVMVMIFNFSQISGSTSNTENHKNTTEINVHINLCNDKDQD